GVAIALGLLSLSAWAVVRWPPAFFAGLLAGGAIIAPPLSAAGWLAGGRRGPLVARRVLRRGNSPATRIGGVGRQAEVARGVSVLKRFRLLADFDQLVIAYEGERDPDRRARLAASYRELTGGEIEHRLAVLRD